MNYIGIDIGSSSSKLAILNEKGELITTILRPTGWDSIGTANDLAAELAKQNIDVNSDMVVATGYGRNAVPYANKSITEISCHGQGATYIFGQEPATVIDIGGQDSKIILIGNGKVRDFIMNDKCSAGTGRFLEIMANTLGIHIAQLCDLAMEGGGVHISSMCTVFAESEVISLIGNGTNKADIAYAIIDSIVDKIYSQATKSMKNDEPVYLTGGLCEQNSFLSALSTRLGNEVKSDPRARYAGAIGAALFAMKL